MLRWPVLVPWPRSMMRKKPPAFGTTQIVMRLLDFRNTYHFRYDENERICIITPLMNIIIFSLALDCPPGWDEFENSCYKVMTSFRYSQRLTWVNARAVCLGFGGDLVSIKNEREMEFLKNLSSTYKYKLFWIGLNDRLKEGQFVWSDGTPFNSSVYNNWDRGQPDNSRDEDCVELHYIQNTWNDLACIVIRYYICERPKGMFIQLDRHRLYYWYNRYANCDEQNNCTPMTVTKSKSFLHFHQSELAILEYWSYLNFLV